MRLSDVIGSLDIATYPQIALVIFLAVFAAVCWRLLRHTTSQQMRSLSMIPLDEPKRVEDQ
jgi:hypothetical protein